MNEKIIIVKNYRDENLQKKGLDIINGMFGEVFLISKAKLNNNRSLGYMDILYIKLFRYEFF
jgi:hypothetical protein